MLRMTYGLHFRSLSEAGQLMNTDAALTEMNWTTKSALTCPKHKLAYVSGPDCPHNVVLLVKQLFPKWLF